jgi:oligopeptide transport system substrate-binding protein
VKQGAARIFGPGGTVRISNTSPETLDPAMAQDVVSWGYQEQIYGGLVRLDDNLRVIPDLASSWTISPDGKAYTFHLRPDAKFQSGRPITADDFKYSLERSLDPATKSPVASVYLDDIVGAQDRLDGKATSVSGIRVLDAHTLQISIATPETSFLSKLTYPTAFVVDRVNAASGPDWTQHPDASGPFELKSYQKDNALVLVRNPNYTGPAPTVGEVDYYLGPDPPIALYEGGKLDVAEVGPGDVQRVTDPQNPLHAALVEVPTLSVSYIGFNTKEKPFDDPHVRRAFAYATNKDQIVNGYFRGGKKLATQMIPPGLAGYDGGYPGLSYDPAKARSELAASSYGSAANLPPISFTVGPGEDQFALGLAQMYKDVLGVNVSVIVLENSFDSDLAAHDLQMYYLGWEADYPDPQDFIAVLFGPDSVANNTQYDNPNVDSLLEEARSLSDASKRAAIYDQADQQIVADAPVIPIDYDVNYVLVSPHLGGLKVTPMGIISFVGVQA